MALRAVHSERRLEICADGFAVPVITQQAEENKRPFIHPILAPDGVGVLTENAPVHHPWQHGLYVGLNAVNGFGFWSEGLGKSEKDGTFHPCALQPPIVDGSAVRWEVVSEWRTPTGEPLLTETQAWAFQDGAETFSLDMAWTLTAHTELTFGKYPYGGLFLRMPYRSETGGVALTSEGLRLPEAEGKCARWVAVAMPIEGRNDAAGIAILDHPSNPEHPVPWRVDGQLGIAPSRCIAREWNLPKDASTTNLYRVLAFCGEPDADALERHWQAFASRNSSGNFS